MLWPEAFFPCLFFLAKSYAVFKLQAKDTILPETLPESWDGGSDSSECTRASRADLRCTAAACLPLASPSTMSSCEQRCLPDTSVPSVQGSHHLNEPLSDPPGRLYNLFSHSPSSPSYCPLTHQLSTQTSPQRIFTTFLHLILQAKSYSNTGSAYHYLWLHMN